MNTNESKQKLNGKRCNLTVIYEYIFLVIVYIFVLDCIHARPTKAIVRPMVPLISCFNAFAEPELISEFFSTALGEKSSATK